MPSTGTMSATAATRWTGGSTACRGGWQGMSDADWATGGGTGWPGWHPTPDSHHLHPLLRPHNVVCAAVEMKFSAQDQYIK